MKKYTILLAVVCCPAFALQSTAQGFFQNLDFEAAMVPDVPAGQFGGNVSIVSGMPGWNGFIGGTMTSQVLHNNYSLGGSALSILGPVSPQSVILDGNYTALLAAGSGGDVSLTQSGLLPADVQSLLFRASPGNGFFYVSLDSVVIALMPIQISSDYTLYGGDVSAFAGQSSQLSFTVISTFGQGGSLNAFYLDSIVFSSEPIPEPSAFTLFGLGALLLGWHMRRKQNR